MNQSELMLIQHAGENSDAFTELFSMYRPVALGQIQRFQLRGMFFDDWMQEARVAMLRAINRFNGAGGSQFGPYYKMVLRAHYASLVRGALAQKRAAFNSASGMGVTTDEVELFFRHAHGQMVSNQNDFTLRLEMLTFFTTLSAAEHDALFKTMRSDAVESAPEKRALERAKTKLKIFLAER